MFIPRYQYIAYLRSPLWDEKRKRRLALSNYCCDICGRAVPLAVHHKHYETLMRESMDDLMSLCEDCHKREDVVRFEQTKELGIMRFAYKRYGEAIYEMDFDVLEKEYDDWVMLQESRKFLNEISLPALA